MPTSPCTAGATVSAVELPSGPAFEFTVTVPDPPFSSQVATDELMLIAARSESAIAGEAQKGSWAKSNDGWISAPGKGTFPRVSRPRGDRMADWWNRVSVCGVCTSAQFGRQPVFRAGFPAGAATHSRQPQRALVFAVFASRGRLDMVRRGIHPASVSRILAPRP